MSFQIQMHRELTQVETKQSPSLGIMNWGSDNTFPQTLKNLIQQSPSARMATSRASKFYKGGPFDGEDQVINSYGLTLKKLVAILADDYADYEAFSIQCNYNIRGQVSSINPIRISTLRFNEFDELNYASKVGYHPDFGRNSEVKKTIVTNATAGNIKWFDRFNINSVKAQIHKTKGGISNYLGQILYFSESGMNSYPIPPLQSCINFVLSDVENSILVRKETSTGFINTYMLKTTMDAEDSTLIALERSIEEAQGARGTGKVITFSGLSPEEVQSTLLEEMGGGGAGSKAVIESSKLAYELSREVITGAYLIPPALAGIDKSSGFSGEDLKEAYFVFNATTQGGRESIQSEINNVLKHSTFDIKKIKINKLRLDLEEGELNAQGEEIISEEEADDVYNDTMRNMSGKQLQALQRVVRKYNKGDLNEAQARMMLAGFGMSEDEINVWLSVDVEEPVEEIQEPAVTSPTVQPQTPQQ
jgi:hypothetical protein